MLAAFIPDTIELSLDPRVLWIVFLVAMIFFTIISAILVYHWLAYSQARAKMSSVMILYFAVSGVFIVTSIVSATMFSMS